eukprot:CAMPEP_0185267786 /NCGR_PEP_ID=MMETSP1359-20130426/35265_1 /TAXON_ID=552665 /ORGANISM="Bigelowiella longifila, Strain CCMP242" /LENGTH=65 /DNA_ID=CAMNT_0027858279 /DNA_START=147 /DNA_END=344 /DNA_ORIENTATION=+
MASCNAASSSIERCIAIGHHNSSLVDASLGTVAPARMSTRNFSKEWISKSPVYFTGFARSEALLK